MRTRIALILLIFTVFITLSLAQAQVTQYPSAFSSGITTRISVASNGAQGNSFSDSSAISYDGRYVAFGSDASNLVPGDTNGAGDIFVHDRQTGQTSRVSVSSDGIQGNNNSFSPAISEDGRYIAFSSWASNLVPGDTGWIDVFVHDRQTGQTSLVSVASDGSQGNNSSDDPAISADGRFITYWSKASNLVPDGYNGRLDIYLYDRQTGETSRVSVNADGIGGNGDSYYPDISPDGLFVAFQSSASNLDPLDTNGYTDIFIHDLQNGQTTVVSIATDGSQANNYSEGPPAISAGGRYIAFVSKATNLVPGDTNGNEDIFVHDRQTGQTSLVSVASDGTQGNTNSKEPTMSNAGRYITFWSGASNLVIGDSNHAEDVFVHDQQTGQTKRVSVASDGTQGTAHLIVTLFLQTDATYLSSLGLPTWSLVTPMR